MGDQTPENVMNLDLNLGPVVHTSRENESLDLNLEDWLDGNRTLARQRWRSIRRPVLFPVETGSASETGEGSMAASDGRPPPEVIKIFDNGNKFLENDIVGGKEDVVKSNENDGGFFNCNICLDMASDPVVTCCGHLFCWPCIYRWLHMHSDVKECPICKGEMTTKTVTPIYGRGNPKRVVEEDLSLKIPHRPQAKRVESWRQSLERNVFSMPMEEMIRRLGSRFDLTRDFPENSRDLSNSLLNRFLTSRVLRTEQNPVLDVDVERLAHREQTTSVDDRDSVSSIAAVIQSESQTVDTAVEIESRVSLSTSSSRRRSESTRLSDVDSVDSRAPRRRRLH